MLKRMVAMAVVASSLLFAAPALADGCQSGHFAGPYVGITLGWARGEAEQYPRNEPKLSGSGSSVAGGALVGYGLQCDRLVVGLEADINWLDVASNTSQPDPAYYRSTIDWYGTLRGRLGIVVHDNMLVYATGGWAYAERTHGLTAPAAPGGAFSQADSDRAGGWVVGGGVELFRNERWMLRLEGLRFDLGKESRDYVVNAGACGGPCRAHVDWDDSLWTARLGVSIKLGGEVQRHEPLK